MNDAAIETERLTVGDYTITRYLSGGYWISREGGEGMQISEEKFERLIDEFYLTEF